ncbi:MAG: Ig-like domain-containing protein [Bdellovibrio sp.]
MVVVPAAASIKTQETLNLAVLNGKAPFKFSSSNASVASVSDSGVVTAVADGTTTITVTDADGKTATSLNMNVGAKSGGGNPPPDDGGGGGGGECPIGEPALCEILCQIMPDLPFCSQ